MAKRIPKKKWEQLFAIISKSGDVELAARISRIGTNQLARMMAKYPPIKQKVNNALASYQKKVLDGRIGHDRPGRPKQTLSEATKERFLYCLQEMGSVRAAANAIGVSTGSLYRLREREPDFAAAWEVATNRGESVEIIAGPWARRGREFTAALPKVGWDLEAAANAAGIPLRLAEILHDKLRPEAMVVQKSQPRVSCSMAKPNSNPGLSHAAAQRKHGLSPKRVLGGLDHHQEQSGATSSRCRLRSALFFLFGWEPMNLAGIIFTEPALLYPAQPVSVSVSIRVSPVSLKAPGFSCLHHSHHAANWEGVHARHS
jgi:hypothetical protein